MGDTTFRQTGRRSARGPYRLDEQIRKQREGAARNAAWAALSILEKLHRLNSRRGNSTKQRKALAA